MGLPSSWLGEMQHKWGQQGKPGRSSYGFCLRNEHGNLIYAEANFIGEAKNTMAEARAIELAPTYYGSNGYSRILLETDSLAMCDIIQKTWKIPWEIADIVEEIYKLFGDTNIQTKHALFVLKAPTHLTAFLCFFAFDNTSLNHKFHLIKCQESSHKRSMEIWIQQIWQYITKVC